MPRPKISIEHRFWNHVDKNGPIPAHCPHLGPCWIWTGAVDKDGYGRPSVERTRRVRAPRISWAWAHGEIPKGKWVLHRCDNPPCVNPDHLFLGTAKDNAQDALAKGRNYVGSKNAFFGRQHTKETRNKIRMNRLGKPLSPEHAQKARQANVGKKRTKEQRSHYSLAAKKRWADGGKAAFGF